jgi:hypothetical protein
MRVAALYDIHGNLPALEPVLAAVGDVDAIVIGGGITEGPSLVTLDVDGLGPTFTQCDRGAAYERLVRSAWYGLGCAQVPVEGLVAPRPRDDALDFFAQRGA